MTIITAATCQAMVITGKDPKKGVGSQVATQPGGDKVKRVQSVSIAMR